MAFKIAHVHKTIFAAQLSSTDTGAMFAVDHYLYVGPYGPVYHCLLGQPRVGLYVIRWTCDKATMFLC